MKPIVLYFSATGGTEHIAKLIASELKAETVDITVFDFDMSFDSDMLVFACFPVYGGRIPAPMYRRMKDIRGDNTPVVPVAVYGNRAVEDALQEMADLCKKNGFRVVGGAEMVAPHSLDRRFGAGRPDEKDVAQLKSFLAALTTRENLRDVPMPGSHDYKPYKGLPLYPSSGIHCSGCGTCSAECPAGAIDQGDPRKPDKTKCISCMRCITVCPFGARSVPKAAQLAVSAALLKMCAGRKSPSFYL